MYLLEEPVWSDKGGGIGMMWTSGMRNVPVEDSVNLAMTSDTRPTTLRSLAQEGTPGLSCNIWERLWAPYCAMCLSPAEYLLGMI